MALRLEKLFENYKNQESIECLRTGGNPPNWLKGSLLRNGPGGFKYGNTEVKHWFDGLAFMQRFHFESGKMFYSARYLESAAYKACERNNRICFSSFGTHSFPDPCRSIYQKFQSFFVDDMAPVDNCLVNFVQMADSIFALTETSRLVKIDRESLETLGVEDMADHLSIASSTAHPQADREGNLFNSGHNFGKSYVFVKTTSSSGSFEDTSLVAEIPYEDPWNPGYHHSFGMSENYIVLFESPVRIRVQKFAFRKLMSYSFQDILYWKKNTDTNVIIVDRKSGTKLSTKFTAPPFFTFHHANTYERDGFLVIDFCHMENPGKFDDFLLVHMRDGTYSTRNPGLIPYLYRMVVPTNIPEEAKIGEDLNSKSPDSRESTAVLQADGSVFCTPAKICSHSFEFPRFNWEKNNMRPYRFVYGSTLLYMEEKGEASTAGVTKTDVTTGKCVFWLKDHEQQLCGEPVFLPDPEGDEEDDGVLLVPVMTVKDQDHPIFLVLDAKDLSEICRYSIPIDRIPPSFHALFVQ